MTFLVALVALFAQDVTQLAHRDPLFVPSVTLGDIFFICSLFVTAGIGWARIAFVERQPEQLSIQHAKIEDVLQQQSNRLQRVIGQFEMHIYGHAIVDDPRPGDVLDRVVSRSVLGRRFAALAGGTVVATLCGWWALGPLRPAFDALILRFAPSPRDHRRRTRQRQRGGGRAAGDSRPRRRPSRVLRPREPGDPRRAG